MLRSLIALVLFAFAFSASAQLPAARLTAVTPPGAKAGATVELKVEGIDLDDATSLQFSHPGITAKKPDGDTKGKANTFTVAIAGDVPVGVYDCRVSGRFGISNPRGFLVHDRASADGVKAGNTPDAAGKLPLNAYVAGQVSANAFDFWSFPATKGQQLTIECAAREIDSKLSPNLAIDDASGREIERSRRTGVIDFTAPADGVYTVRVSDGMYRGGAEFSYLICASSAPRLSHVFPPSAKPGQKTSFTVYGRNLPGGKKSDLLAADGKPLEQAQVEIDLPAEPTPAQSLTAAGVVSPASAALTGFAYRMKGDYGTSNAVPILYTATAPVTEEEAADPAKRNDTGETAQKLSLPAEVAGRFYPRNDRDQFTFDARKGDVFYIEIVCDRLGQPAAPMLVLQRITKDDKGEKASDVLTSPEDESNTGVPAFRTATRDFAMKWDVKEDGVYRAVVRDRFAVSRDDGALRYHLSIRKPSPDFQFAATPVSTAPGETAVWNTQLRKAGAAPIRVSLFRQDDFDRDVTVSVVGLPQGVKAEPIVLPGKESAGMLMLVADADAKPWSGRIGVVATAKGDNGEIKRQARAGAIVAGTPADGKANNNSLDIVVSRLVNDLAISVIDEAEPVSLSVADDKTYEVVSGEKITIPLKVAKSADLKAALKLKAVGHDALKQVKEINVDVKADKASLELDTKTVKLPPGTHVFYLASPAQFKYKRPGVEEDPKDKKKTEAKDVTANVVSSPIVVKVLAAPDAPKKK